MKEIDVGSIYSKLKEIVERASKLINKPNNDGGYCCITTSSEEILAVFLVGEIADPKEAASCCGLCQEKATRLSSIPEHYSSWQSRVMSLQKYGGAIRAGDLIFSFSGLPEKWDESCMLVLANNCGYIGVTEMNHIAQISDNPHVTELLGFF